MDLIELGLDVEVELDVFSGRRNPRWSFAGNLARDLEERMRRAEPGEALEPPGLGYRGFVFTAADGARVRVYDGAVSVERAGATHYFRDRAELEERLLAFARDQGFGELLDEFETRRGLQSG